MGVEAGSQKKADINDKYSHRQKQMTGCAESIYPG